MIAKYKNEITGVVIGFCLGLVLLAYGYRQPEIKMNNYPMLLMDFIFKFLTGISAMISVYISSNLNIGKYFNLFFLSYFVLIGLCFGKVIKLSRKKILILFILILLIIHSLGLWFWDAFLQIMLEKARVFLW